MASVATETKVSIRRTGWTFWRRFFWLTRVSVTLLAVTLLGVAIGTYASLSQVLPSPEELANFAPDQTTKIYSSDGQLLAKLFRENREIIPISEIPQQLQNATIAVEDERFREHVGADLRGIARAAYRNWKSHSIEQGGSTITEQLAKNVFLSPEKTFARRLQQMMLALRIERRYSKEEILQLYLNEICYGHGAYGVQAAAKVYFGKPASQLNVAECALLAGLPRRPSYYSPYENREIAKARRKTVLDKMAELGFITWEEAEEADKEPIRLAGRQPMGLRQYRAPYFSTFVIRELTRRYGSDMLQRGGLSIYTTLNVALQQEADRVVREQVERLRRNRVSQAALVCIEAKTGRILAIVGGVNFLDDDGGQWNRATQARRQPGSSFKPYVYAIALESGFSPESRMRDAPLDHYYADGRAGPKNYDGKYRGIVTLRTALSLSINCASVQLLKAIGEGRVRAGAEKVVGYARRLGITSPLDAVASLTLGSSGVTLLEHTAGYGCFATGGFRLEPTGILRVLDAAGNVLEEHFPTPQRVLSPRAAQGVRSMMVSVVESGTGRAARIPGVQVAGKTGTTDYSTDVWFLGFTPDLVVGVWVGNDSRVSMRGASGGHFCAPVWKEFVVSARRILSSRATSFEEAPVSGGNVRPPKPVGATSETPRGRALGSGEVNARICSESGLRATGACPLTHYESYPRGQAPSARCDLHSPPRRDSHEDTGPAPHSVTGEKWPSPSEASGTPAPPRPEEPSAAPEQPELPEPALPEPASQ